MAFTKQTINRFTKAWTLSGAANLTGAAEQPPVSLGVAAVQIVGTFGGATALLEVSENGVDWVQMADRAGNNISVTAAARFEISSACQWIRARTSGGGGTTNLTFNLVAWGM